MKKVKYYLGLTILICLAFYWGCKKEDKSLVNKPSLSNLINVKIPNSNVDTLTTTSIKDKFNENTILFGIANSSSYEIRISLGKTLPQIDSFLVEINLPSSFNQNSNSNSKVLIGGLFYENGSIGKEDEFELFRSTYDNINHKVSAYLPIELFINDESTNDEYVAFLKIASISLSSKKSANIVSSNNLEMTCPAPKNSCFVTGAFGTSRMTKCPDGSYQNQIHTGVDFRAAIGDPVVAAADGEIVLSQHSITLGYNIIISHSNGTKTRYCHLSEIIVSSGSVKKGQLIAKAGNSGSDRNGNAVPAHLHFEYITPNFGLGTCKNPNTLRTDPLPYIVNASLCKLTTTQVTNITTNSASSGGNITSDGGAEISARGVCWNTSSNPTINDYLTTDGLGTGSFTSSINDLSDNTTYYLRAYATNSAGTAYGNEITFTTKSYAVPIVTTEAVTNITTTSASFNGTVVSNNGFSITEKGFEIKEPGDSYFGSYVKSSSTATGTYSINVNISTFTPNSIYAIRAYAKNSQGTGYGSEVTFTTTDGSSTSSLTLVIDGQTINFKNKEVSFDPAGTGFGAENSNYEFTIFNSKVGSYDLNKNCVGSGSVTDIRLDDKINSTGYDYYINNYYSLSCTGTETYNYNGSLIINSNDGKTFTGTFSAILYDVFSWGTISKNVYGTFNITK